MIVFYNRVTHVIRSMLHVATDGTLMSKMEVEVYNSIKEIMLDNYSWSNKRDQPKRFGGT